MKEKKSGQKKRARNVENHSPQSLGGKKGKKRMHRATDQKERERLLRREKTGNLRKAKLWGGWIKKRNKKNYSIGNPCKKDRKQRCENAAK